VVVHGTSAFTPTVVEDPVLRYGYARLFVTGLAHAVDAVDGGVTVTFLIVGAYQPPVLVFVTVTVKGCAAPATSVVLGVIDAMNDGVPNVAEAEPTTPTATPVTTARAASRVFHLIVCPLPLSSTAFQDDRAHPWDLPRATV
jgi:hypothetical protein